MTDNFEVLYEKYNVLSEAKEKASQHTKEYLECIDGTKGGSKEKQLAAQIIAKFFKHFTPDIQDQALNAILDLCEDTDSQIRISAMKVLPQLCKDAKNHVKNIASILSQLLQLDDQEYIIACNSLVQVFKEFPSDTIAGIMTNIQSPTDDSLREKCVMFLFKKLIKTQGKLNPELEDLLIEEGKKIIQDSTANEFTVVIPYFMSSKLVKTTAGQKELVDLVAERAELDHDFEPQEEGFVDRIIMCVEYILPVFNANVESTNYVKYYCDQILPRWEEVGELKEGSVLQFQLMRQLAELSTHCGTLDTPSLQVVQIFDKMKRHMPPPPEDVDIVEMPNLDFTTVECLLYAFHRLARQCPDFLTSDPQVLKDFRARLTYFSRGVQGCKRSLEKGVAKNQINEENSDSVKIAPAVLDNINSLIKDLFYQPPVYKCNIQLSFKKFEKTLKVANDKPTATQKRHVPITFDSSNGASAKQVRGNKSGDNVKLYTPPSGKFSNNFNRSGPLRGARRGGNRGGNRGRWRN